MSEVIAQQKLEQESPGKLGNTVTPENTTYDDSSGAIFSMYITQAQKLDEENVENWTGVADRILIFVRFETALSLAISVVILTSQTGLFSSTVATFISISYQSLQQDPHIITQSLLAQISQQLSNTTSSDTNGFLNISIRDSFVPPASAVFVNTAWFLSLVLSLMCALLAILLQQWARRYLQTVRRNHAPHVRAHIREYFARGASKFHIFGLIEALPFLLLVSMHLFFAGLVAFAFRANYTVAHSTLAIVGFCVLSYITLTLVPLIFHDCPYYTPLTSVIWFSSRLIPLSFFSVLYHGAKKLYDRWGAVSESTVKSFHQRYRKKARSWSQGMISELEDSAKHISMDIYKNTLLQTLHWLQEDRDLEEFVAGIPGLCESKALTMQEDDTQRTIRDVLAALPGPTNFHASLPWSIIELAQRTFTSKLPKSVQQRRTRACMKALYYIPGAIRDILAPYAAREHFYLEIVPLLNSSDSLAIIDELWDTPNHDVALSIRCVAAVVSAFMITPPRPVLDNFVDPDVCYTADDLTVKQFLDKRFHFGAGPDGSNVSDDVLHSDSARLQNIVRFLTDIKEYTNLQWWMSENAYLVRRECRALFDTRHMDEYLTDRGMFDQQGDRASPAFIPAAQQDLITLTLEILARDPVANAATSQREAFHDACRQLGQVAVTQARVQARAQTRAQTQVLPELVLETLALAQAQASDSIAMVKHALEPIARSLQPQADETPAPYDDPSPPQILEPQIAPVTTECPEDHSIPAHADSMHSTQNSTPSSTTAGREPAAGGLGHLNWADNLV